MTELFKEFSDFLVACPTPYHFCNYARSVLKSLGFTEISEKAPPMEMPKNGFIIRSERSLFAYKDNGHNGSVIVGSHCDSPVFCLKPKHEETQERVRKVRVSNYGGGTWHTWLDRPLKLAGMILHRTEKGVKMSLFDSGKAVAIIPAAAVHFGENGLRPEFDLEDHFCPIYGTSKCSRTMLEYVSDELKINPEDIEHYDLRFLNSQKPALLPDGLIVAEQLDDLSSTFSSFKAFLESEPEDGFTSAIAVFDNEEIGSLTKNGGNNSFISDCLMQICNDDEEEQRVMKENSLIISCDVGHATHPNWPTLLEENHPVRLGAGPSVAITAEPSTLANHAMAQITLSNVAKGSNVNLQKAVEKNLGGGGSTIGPMSEMWNGIPTIDFGMPLLAMHSIREIGSVDDLQGAVDILKEAYAHYSQHKASY